MLVADLDVMLLFVSPTSTFHSPNSLYLKTFGFSRHDFRCFGDKDSFSIPQTEELVFVDFKVHKKRTIMTDTTIYYTS